MMINQYICTCTLYTSTRVNVVFRIYNNVPSCHKHVMMYQPCRNRTTGTTNYNLKDRGIYLLDFLP